MSVPRTSVPGRSRRLVAVLVVAVLAVVGTAAVALTQRGDDRRTGVAADVLEPPAPPEVAAQQLAAVPPGKQVPLRRGEQRMTLEMDTDYTPSAPTGVGTDDYRCFLLDPGLEEDVWLTGSQVLPGNPDVVHHVILFKVDADQVAAAEELAERTVDPGWTCFGGSGLEGDFSRLTDANMQVHYNLLKGAAPDRSATQLRWMPGATDLQSLHTYLMPAPVELPCRDARSEGPLCDRDAAMVDLRQRFGGASLTADALHLLCGELEEPSETTTCTRRVSEEMTVLGVGGHMHLLGREISVVANQGTPQERTLLDIDLWDFDDQGAQPVEPLTLQPGDTLTVTCRHEQWLRDKLPAFEGQQEKYVLWGEGSTDEMCLGTLSVAYAAGAPTSRF